MEQPPLITAVIPTFRRPSLLKRAALSVLRQTQPLVRVEIYDNASGDETGSLVQRMQQRDDRVEYFCHPTNIGALPNFDFGMRRVGTPFFSLLSDDDVLLPGWYAAALSLFDRYPEAVFVASRVAVVDDRGRVLSVGPSQWRTGIHRPPKALLEMARLGHPVWTGTVFRREVLDRVGPLNLALKIAVDVEFEMRIAAREPFVTTDDVGACFQVHERSSVSSMRADEMWAAYAELSDALGRLPALEKPVRGMVLAQVRGNAARSLMRHGLSALARRDWMETRRTSVLLAPLDRRFAVLLRQLSRVARLGGSQLLKLALRAKRHTPGAVLYKQLQQDYQGWLKTLDASFEQ